MFVPPSPSQAGDTPGTVRRLASALSGEQDAIYVSSSSGESAAASPRDLGRMADNRKGGGEGTGSGGGGAADDRTGQVPAAVLADDGRPAPINLKEAAQVGASAVVCAPSGESRC